MFDNVSQKLRDSKKIVFVTGAGISQESGIPTFRGEDGHWRKHDPMKLASIDAFFDDPKLVWEWYEDRRKTSWQQNQRGPFCNFQDGKIQGCSYTDTEY